MNEALNNIYIEEEDYEKLDVSVSTYTNYDQLELAGQLQKVYPDCLVLSSTDFFM